MWSYNSCSTSHRWGKEAHEKPDFASDNRKEVLCQEWYSCWEKKGLPVTFDLVPVRGCLYLQKAACSSLLGGSQQEQLPGCTSPWHKAASLAEILPASGEPLFPLKQDTIEHYGLPNTDPPQELHRQEFALGDPGKSEICCLLGSSSTSCTIRGFQERGRKLYFKLIVA